MPPIEDTVKKLYFDEASASLKEYGRYWNGVLDHALAKELRHQLTKHFEKNVAYQQTEARWEFVYYLPDNDIGLENIAKERDQIIEANESLETNLNTKEYQLPV